MTNADENTLPPDADRLHDALHELACALVDVRELAFREASRIRQIAILGGPSTNDWQALDEEGDIDRGEPGSWRQLLLTVRDNLSVFWAVHSEAESALQAMSPGTQRALSEPFAAGWTVRCRSALDNAAKWLYWTRAAAGRPVDVSQFLNVLQSGNPDLSPVLGKLDELRDELFALRGRSDVQADREKTQIASVAPLPATFAGNLEGVIDETTRKIGDVAADTSLSASERMSRICHLDERYWQKDSAFWAGLLGVSGSAVRKTPFWKSERAYVLQRSLDEARERYGND